MPIQNNTHGRRIVIHLFVYEGDSAIVMENIKCARNAVPEAEFVIIDDALKPCPDEVREEALDFGAEWRSTTWDRGGNLRGKTCIEGILDELLASARNDDDILAKIDADTCLLDGSSLIRFAESEQVIWGSGDPDVRIYGCAYALRAHAARRVRSRIASLELYPNSPEDVVIGFTTVELFPDRDLYDITPPLSKQPGDGKWAAYNWSVYPDVLPFYDNHMVVTTGNIPKAPLGKKHRLPVMKALRIAYENKYKQ